MSMNKHLILALVGSMSLALGAGCSDAGDAASFEGGGGNAGVGQGGAQDFGQFRDILDAGDLPGPETLDDVGFFNEHKIELPTADCGGNVCVHGELGVMGNMINGSNCTLVMLGMNTPIDPNEIDRPPLNLAIVVDTSGSMQGEPMDYLKEGLFRMLDDLQPEDRISLVGFSGSADTKVEFIAGDDAELNLAIGTLSANGPTNIYDGLRTGYELVEANADPERQNRVILLSDGEATAGITAKDKIVSMSAAYNEEGYSLTTIGVGTDFDPELMRELSESGAGAFYYLEDPQAVQEVFEQEVQTFLVPLAKDVVIDFTVDPGYTLRQIYGTKLAEQWGNQGHIEIPSLQIAHRTSVSDNEGGRRGGGGAIIAELVPRSPDQAVEVGTVGLLTMTYDVPGSDESVTEEIKIQSPLQPGETPEEGHFSFNGVEKSFVMLNILAGFEMAANRASFGDFTGARGVLDSLRGGVVTWLETNDDEDIADDLRYIDKFIENLDARGALEAPPDQTPPNPWPND